MKDRTVINNTSYFTAALFLHSAKVFITICDKCVGTPLSLRSNYSGSIYAADLKLNDVTLPDRLRSKGRYFLLALFRMRLDAVARVPQIVTSDFAEKRKTV